MSTSSAGKDRGLGEGYPVFASKLAELGLTSLRFDFSGNGESEGEFEYANYRKEVSGTVLGQYRMHHGTFLIHLHCDSNSCFVTAIIAGNGRTDACADVLCCPYCRCTCSTNGVLERAVFGNIDSVAVLHWSQVHTCRSAMHQIQRVPRRRGLSAR